MEVAIALIFREKLVAHGPGPWRAVLAFQPGVFATAALQFPYSAWVFKRNEQLAREREVREQKFRQELALAKNSAVVDGESLTEYIQSHLKDFADFEGTFDVYNAEMNTIENVEFWRHLCTHPGIRKIRIALPPGIFKRFENALADNRNKLYEALATAGDRLAVLPVPVNAETAAFAVAIARSKSNPDRTRVFVFHKTRPDSSPSSELGKFGSIRWNYDHFQSYGPGTQYFADCIATFDEAWKQHIGDGAFTVDEMRMFGARAPIELKRLIEWHNLNDSEIQELHAVADHSGVSVVERAIDGERHIIRFSGNSGQAEAEILPSALPDVAPVAVWLPPWGMGNWSYSVREIDKRLGRKFRIAHLRNYSGNESLFSVSGAMADARALLDELRRNGGQYGIDPSRIVVIGTSIGAFVTATLAPDYSSSVRAIALLSPVLDVFEALDAYPRVETRKEMVTRRTICGKKGFRFGELKRGGLQLLGAWAEPHFVLELGLRGMGRCSSEFVGNQLRKYHDAGGRVILAASPLDEMTPPWLVDDMFKATGLGKRAQYELNWPHRIRERVFDVSDVNHPGIDSVIAELERSLRI